MINKHGNVYLGSYEITTACIFGDLLAADMIILGTSSYAQL